MEDHPNPAAQIHSIEQDLAFARVVQAGEQLNQGSFPGPVATDQGDIYMEDEFGNLDIWVGGVRALVMKCR